MAVPIRNDLSSRLLVVEGKTDLYVVAALAELQEIPQFQIEEGGGVDGALSLFDALMSASDGPETLALVLDANGRPATDRWRVLEHEILPRHGYEVASLEQGGVILEGGYLGRRIGLWIMPDNESPGQLEDLCLRMLAPEAGQFLANTVERAEVEGMTSFREAHRSKALIHTYLAWQDEPGRPLGLAFKGNTLDAFHPAAEGFVTWLRALFGESPWAELDRLGAQMDRSSTSSKTSGEILDEIRRRDWD